MSDWRITIELDCHQTQAERVFDALTTWAHTDQPGGVRLPSVAGWSPAVALEPGHPDLDELWTAQQVLAGLGFDTAADAIRAARRNLHHEEEETTR